MKCVIDGAYGFNNVGDEAMLSTASKILKSMRPDIDIIVSSHRPVRITELHGLDSTNQLLLGTVVRNLLKFRIKSLKKQIIFFNNIDILLFAGGSILNDSKGIRNIFVIMFKVLLSSIFNFRIVFWGVSIGYPNTKVGYWIIKWIIKKSNLIILRDESSYEIAKKMCPDNNIKLGVDILFSLDVKKKLMKKGDNLKLPLRIGISIRPYPPVLNVDLKRYDDLIIEHISKACKKISAKDNVVFVPLVFSEGEGQKDDAGILRKIIELSKLNNFDNFLDNINVVNNSSYAEYLNKLLLRYQSLDLVIGERFHSLVMAQLLSVPYIGLSYDPKICGLAMWSDVEDCIVNLVPCFKDGSLYQEILSIYDIVYERKSSIELSAQKILKISKQDRLEIKKIFLKE